MSSRHLRWNAGRISKLMQLYGIRNRTMLATALGLSRAAVYEAFNPHWDGVATLTVLTRLACAFDEPLDVLVIKPATAIKVRIPEVQITGGEA